MRKRGHAHPAGVRVRVVGYVSLANGFALTRIRVKPSEQVLEACKTVAPFPFGCWEAGGMPTLVHGS